VSAFPDAGILLAQSIKRVAEKNTTRLPSRSSNFSVGGAAAATALISSE